MCRSQATSSWKVELNLWGAPGSEHNIPSTTESTLRTPWSSWAKGRTANSFHFLSYLTNHGRGDLLQAQVLHAPRC